MASEKEPAGIARNSIELLKELDKFVEPGEVVVLAPKCSYDTNILKNIEIKKMGYFGPEKNLLIQRLFRAFWRRVIFPVYCKSKCALTVNTTLAWKRFDFDVMSIYDCTHDLFPEFIMPEKTSWYNTITESQKRNCKKAKMILTDSCSSRTDINKIYGFDIDKIKVIYCGWQHFKDVYEDDSVISRYNLQKYEYFFHLEAGFLIKILNGLIMRRGNIPNINLL